MSEEQHGDLREQTQQLLQGSLKHVRAAALAAALVPLASLAVSPAVAQTSGSGGVAVVPTPCDFITSGGFVLTDDGKEANFGAHGGCKNGEFWGHVNFVDHTTGYHLDSIAITGYLTPGPGSNTRYVCGLARTNGSEPQPVAFRVSLTDNGEPGVADTFGIRTSAGYAVTTRLLGAGRSGGGGNVQLHDANRSTTAPNPVPDEYTMCGGVDIP
jgi:hypothetical protein